VSQVSTRDETLPAKNDQVAFHDLFVINFVNAKWPSLKVEAFNFDIKPQGMGHLMISCQHKQSQGMRLVPSSVTLQDVPS